MVQNKTVTEKRPYKYNYMAIPIYLSSKTISFPGVDGHLNINTTIDIWNTAYGPFLNRTRSYHIIDIHN